MIKFIKENKVECAIAYMLFFGSFNYYIQNIIAGILGVTGKTIPMLLYGLGIVVSLYSYSFVVKKKENFAMLIVMVIGTGLFALMHPESIGLIYTEITDLAYNPLLKVFLYSVPLFFLSTIGKDSDRLLKILLFLSRFCISVFLFAYLIYLRNQGAFKIEYMTFSYHAMPAICICFASRCSGTIKLIDRIISLLAIVVVFVSGSRGCLISIFTFILLYYLFIEKAKKSLILFLIALFVVLQVNFDSFLTSFSSILDSSGIQSRTISMFLDKTFVVSEGRDNLINLVKESIWDSPFIGHGMWGDRPIVNGYCHNFIYEIWCDYGLIFGSAFLLLIFGGIAKNMFKLPPNSQKIILCASIPMGLVQLLFSGSYLLEPWFYFLIGQLYYFNKKADR